LDRQSTDARPFLKFRQDDGYTSIDRVKVRRNVVLDEPKTTAGPADEVRVLLRYSNGQPAIVGKKRVGEGEVLLFTTAANDEHWNDWFLSLPFVPFVQVSLNHLLEGQPQLHNRVAGEPIRWQPPKTGAASSYDLLRPDGKRVRLGYPETVEGRPLLTAAETPRAGVYRLARTDGQPLFEGADKEQELAFAVVPDLRETEDLDSYSDRELAERLGIKVVQVKAGDDGAVFSGAERLKREWTVVLLWVLLALVLAEAVMAWVCGRAW
jgi:ADP-ribose pyrophosphatase YjhB (NUDIX family)